MAKGKPRASEKTERGSDEGHAARKPAYDVTSIRPEHLYKAVGLSFLLLFLYQFFPIVSQVLLLIFASTIVAVALNPLTRSLPLERSWVAAGVAILTFGTMGFLVWLGANLVVDQFRGVIEILPEIEERLIGWVLVIEDRTGFNLELLRDDPLQRLGVILSDALSLDLLGHAPAVLSAIFIPLIILVGGFFALAKPHKALLEPLTRLVPRDRRPVFYRIMDLLGARLLGWVRGTLLAMLGVGILSTIALYLLGVEYALALGIFMGITEFVPLIGPWIGGAPAVLVAFLESPTKGLWTIVAIWVVQQIESNIITPWAMSSQANVHPMITLFSLILFGGLFGFLGILLAIPLTLFFGTIIEVLWIETTVATDADYIPPLAGD